MKRLVKKREPLEMDLTPLIDVVFLLLIFFIVASEFKKNETLLNLSLPTSASTQKMLEQKEVVLEVSPDEIAYETTEVTLDELKNKLMVLDKTVPLTVKIDKEVKYSRVVMLLDIFNELELSNLLLVTKQEEDD